jgi:hypothetical protein
MKRFVGIAAVAAAMAGGLALAACGGPDITAGRVDNAMGPTFAALYQHQQDLLGKPPPATPQASASCHRSGQGAGATGAGDDWICVVLLQVGAPLAQYTYELNVQADGCYTADGPPALIGNKSLTTSTGASRVNPLFAFDGCFDT